jgi:hypothetical protein
MPGPAPKRDAQRRNRRGLAGLAAKPSRSTDRGGRKPKAAPWLAPWPDPREMLARAREERGEA